jgi:hypothetical protein
MGNADDRGRRKCEYEVQGGPLSAGVILSTAPVAVLFTFCSATSSTISPPERPRSEPRTNRDVIDPT